MAKWWDIKTTPVKPVLTAQGYQIRRLLDSIPHGGIVNGKAYLIVYNRAVPERSYVICEGL